MGDHEVFRDRQCPANREGVIRFLAFDQDYGNSIVT
jgi:hypothetical protein